MSSWFRLFMCIFFKADKENARSCKQRLCWENGGEIFLCFSLIVFSVAGYPDPHCLFRTQRSKLSWLIQSMFFFSPSRTIWEANKVSKRPNENRSKSYTKLRNNYRKVNISVTIVILCTIEFVCPVAMTNLLNMGKSRQVCMNQYPLR